MLKLNFVNGDLFFQPLPPKSPACPWATVLDLILVHNNQDVGVELVKGLRCFVDVCPSTILPYIVNSFKVIGG